MELVWAKCGGGSLPILRPGDCPSMDIPCILTWRLPFYGHSPCSDLETALLWTFPVF